MVGIPDSEGMPVDFERLTARSVRLQFDSTVVSVASLDDVITSKEFANRAKDRHALPELYRLRDAQRQTSPAPRETPGFR